jgi:hypothetical protein
VGVGAVQAVNRRVGDLKPVEEKGGWILGGLALQLAGVGGPAAYVYEKAKHQNVGGSITQGTIRLVWHEAVHSKTGLAILIAGAVVFATGAMVLARPFCKHVLVLIVAVPIAAVAGMLVLGVGALIVAVLCLGVGELLDGIGGGGGGGGSGGSSGASGASIADAAYIDPGDSSSARRKRQQPEQPQGPPSMSN